MKSVSSFASVAVLLPMALVASGVLLCGTAPAAADEAMVAPPGAREAPPPSTPVAGDARIPGAEAVPSDPSARVGGDRSAVSERRGEAWVFDSMRIETPLPEGYPPPTPPGAIDLKTYPSVRRAEFTGSGNSDLGMNFGFWPLFQHIKKREIAMTSPVEMEYTGWEGDSSSVAGAWTMSFLYRTADLGPTGEDGKIKVVDVEPITVLAIGMRGAYRLEGVAEGMARLEAWLAESQEWERDGDPRAFYYNGPEKRNADKWAEAQLPVRRKVMPGAPPSTTPPQQVPPPAPGS